MFKIILIFCTLWSFVAHAQNMPEKKYTGKPIHIFLEGYATNPALLGMLELVQLPPDELKIIAWHRFPNRKNIVDLAQINAIEMNISSGSREGFWPYISANLIKFIQPYLEKYPTSPLRIYTNVQHTQHFLYPFLPTIDADRIQEIHLYEDGCGSVIQRSNLLNKMAFSEIEQPLKKAILDKQKIPYDGRFQWSMQHFYPVTYYLCEADFIKTAPEFKKFVEWLGVDHIKNVDFREYNKLLTPAQKKLFYQLVGFDESYFKEHFSKKKNLVFAGGFFFDNVRRYNAEIKLLAEITHKLSDYQIWFKPHPSFSTRDLNDTITKLLPSVKIIPAQLPYEAFIVAGLEPELVSGLASSLFYSLKDEQLVSYIPRSPYEEGFQLLNKFKSAKKLKLQEPKRPFFFDYVLLDTTQKQNYLIRLNDKNWYHYNQVKKVSLTKTDENSFTLTYPKEEQENYILNESDFEQNSFFDKCIMPSEKGCKESN